MHFTPFETYPSGHTHVNPLQFAPCGHALQSTLLVDSSVYLFEYAHHNMEEVLMPTFRPPVKPVSMGMLADAYVEGEEGEK